MASELTAQQIIDSVLRLPLAEQERVLHVLQESLIDETISNVAEEPADEVNAAWSEEIARRIADIESGRVKTVPAEEAERMIRDNGPPRV